MKKGKIFYLIIAAALLTSANTLAQTILPGVNYQAVARDYMGKEVKNATIDVRFSIISNSPSGEVVYRETHINVLTSPYGVFSLIIGEGSPDNTKSVKYATFSQIGWDAAPHFVKVEVKFQSDYIDMGTMQFMAVPYALYAYKSLEPGPVGPKGDKGDPASDNQTLSFDGKKLSLTVGDGGTPSQVDISSLNPPHALSIIGDTVSILGGNKIGLPNYMQDLTLDVNNILRITKNPSAASLNLTKYLDNTDGQTLAFDSGTNRLTISGGNFADLSKFHQQLSFNPTTNRLSISNGTGDIDLTPLKNDPDPDPTNELQSLSFDKNTGNLSISSGTPVSLNNPIGFKAKKSVSQSGLTIGTTYPFVNSDVEFDEGMDYNSGTGAFTAPIEGIYTFLVTYKADGAGSGRVLSILKNGSVYEVLGPDIISGTELSKWVIMKLNQGDFISLTINTGMSTYSGTGTFAGYRNN